MRIESEKVENIDTLLGRTLGGFVIREKLGEGGFGAVYRAEQQILGRKAVIKILHKKHHSKRELIERFIREAKLASQLEHPYTAHIYDFGAEPDGLLWIAMEFVRGVPLSTLIKKQGSLPLERAVPLLDKICEVVHTAHEVGIVHRDIKPANVMVISRAGKLLPKLLDFGIAKGGLQPEGLVSTQSVSDFDEETQEVSITEPLWRVGAEDVTKSISSASEQAAEVVTAGAVGSPPYMAPEQWTNSKIGPRTDIYALGVLAYELLTGRRPFSGTPSELFKAHLRSPVPSLGSGFPEALDQVIAKAMSKKPEERYSTAIDFAAAFRRAAGFADELVKLPALDELTLESVMTMAPQPVAEAVSGLAAVRNIYQAKEQLREVASTVAHYIGIVALACVVRAGISRADDQLSDYLSRLRTGSLDDSDWVDLAVAVCRQAASEPDLFSVPELVDFLLDSSGNKSPQAALLEQLIDPPGSSLSEDQLYSFVKEAFSKLATVFLKLEFLNKYHLLVVHDGIAERWMGMSLRLEESARASGIYLVNADGEQVCELTPLVRIESTYELSSRKLFLFYGRGRQGARFVSHPHRFECNDETALEWFSKKFVPELEEEATVSPEVRTPYKGLSAFTIADADLFFGREREVERVINRLRVQPIVAIVGPSGAGKSSFVQAGVLPELKGWSFLLVRPGASPVATICGRLRRHFSGFGGRDRNTGRLTEIEATMQMSKLWMGNFDFLHFYLYERLASAGNGILIVVDQFEEIFTLCLDVEERRAYCEGLARAAASADIPIRLILTLRDDFLLRARELPALGERLSQGLELLGTPDKSDLIRILVEPAHRSGYSFEDEQLPREIAESVAGKQGALPLLAFTASRLWEMRDRQNKLLRRRTYESLGGVGGALAQHAEDVMCNMTREEQLLVREAFRRLVTSEGTRAVMNKDELLQVLGGSSVAEAVVEKLIQARLLSAWEGEGGQERVEVVHEALLVAWPRLVRWRQEDAESARLREQLQAAAKQWNERGRPKGLLWRDEALLEYELWRARYPGRLTQIEEAFAQASIEEAQRLKSTQRLLMVSAVAVLLIGFLVLFWQRQKALSSENEARMQVINLYVEQGRQELLAGNAARALAFLNEAYSAGRDEPSLRFMIRQARLAVEPPKAVFLEGHADSVLSVAFSPDGKYIATASVDSTVRLYSSDCKLLTVIVAHEGSVNSVAFRPDSKMILTAGSDGNFKMWTLDGRYVLAVQAHDGPVNCAAFSPDGKRIVTAGLDRLVRVWDVDGKCLLKIEGHSSNVLDAKFSPDGRLIVSAGHDSSVRLWNSIDGGLEAVFVGHEGTVHSVGFSPDATYLVTSGSDGSIKVWEVATKRLLGSMEQHHGIVRSAVYSPDGALIASGSSDRTLKFWDARSLKLLKSDQLSEFGINDVAFSPDGKKLLTAFAGQLVQMFDVQPEDSTPQEIAAFVYNKLGLRLVGDRLESVQGKESTAKHNFSKATYVTPSPASFTLNRYSFDVVQVDTVGRVIKRTTKEVRYFSEDLGNGVTLDMVAIPGGSFWMGSPEEEKEREREFEGPRRKVEVKPFFMSRFEITQAQWKAIMGTNPSHFKGEDLPVDSVSWYEAMEFCERLSEKTGRLYRLPTEAEWEYACRAGTETPFHFGPTITSDLVNYRGSHPYGLAPRGIFRERPTQVGSFGVANGFGLYDMHGNVVEWVLDALHKGYEGAPSDARAWEHSDDLDIRVLRGGSWASHGYVCRSAFRSRYSAATKHYLFGFRVVMCDRAWLASLSRN
ncbi:MAG: SUMF1/EgtB/PvdO family nonheme iron enzyme [Acidobacteriota bacterium]|nr:SUMF1/EgtB/PvdO family nonheme iron enzyme [Blastocatellia bacterium]MDW8413454.1 SUMF1/EgtB/PvdO family nonheme iron enzyme [Acidobacteriota bacterium]